MTWILTYTGRAFDLAAPRADLISTVDIAHSLSMICRFGGHPRRHYSVAQHSLLVAGIVPPEHQLIALLHDATEAYVGDMVRPIKLMMSWHHDQCTAAWLSSCIGSFVGPASACEQMEEISPGFNLLLDAYKQIEHRVWLAICDHFHLEPELPDCVKEADMIALATERRELMPDHPAAWDCLAGVQALPQSLANWQPETARQAFHDRLLELMATTHRTRAEA